MQKGRGRLSSIQLLPRECSHIVQWAAAELQANDRSQIDIYADFVSKLEQVQRESRGEIEFEIPGIRSFNRYSTNLDAMAREINEAREMAAAIAGTFDATESDNLTLVATEAIKGFALSLMQRDKKNIDAKALQALSNAVHKAAQAQGVSTSRRQKVEAEFKVKVDKVFDTVAKEKGMSAEVVGDLKNRLLGARPKKKELQ